MDSSSDSQHVFRTLRKSADVPELSALEEHEKAIKALSIVHSNPVAFSLKTNVKYDGNQDNDTPLDRHTVTFKAGEFIHIYENFNDNWWIGRLVREDSPFVFVPSPDYLNDLIRQHHKPKPKRCCSITVEFGNASYVHGEEESDDDEAVAEGAVASPVDDAVGGAASAGAAAARVKSESCGPVVTPPPVVERRVGIVVTASETLSAYDLVPIMRPVFLVGPTLKGNYATTMLHKLVYEYLSMHFEGRIKFKRVKADLSLGTKLTIENSTNDLLVNCFKTVKSCKLATTLDKAREAKEEIDRLFALASKMQLLVVDCDRISFPSQLERTLLAPIFIYLKVESQEVFDILKKRGEEWTLRGKLLKCILPPCQNVQRAADNLKMCRDKEFDLIVNDHEADIALEKIGNFLEGYWRATRVPKPGQ